LLAFLPVTHRLSRSQAEKARRSDEATAMAADARLEHELAGELTELREFVAALDASLTPASLALAGAVDAAQQACACRAAEDARARALSQEMAHAGRVRLERVEQGVSALESMLAEAQEAQQRASQVQQRDRLRCSREVAAADDARARAEARVAGVAGGLQLVASEVSAMVADLQVLQKRPTQSKRALLPREESRTDGHWSRIFRRRRLTRRRLC